MFDYLLKRIFSSLLLILFITFISFGLMKLDFVIPKLDIKLLFWEIQSEAINIKTGDPLADLRLNPSISQEQIKFEEQRLGLGKSFVEQYFLWLKNILYGDFGLTQSNQKVIDKIRPALWNTFCLNFSALILTWLLSLPLGVWAAYDYHKQGSKSHVDGFLRLLTAISMSIPSFVLAIFALIFALYSGCFPIGGLTSIGFEEMDLLAKIWDLFRHLFLPVMILVILGFASIQRQMRANLLDVLGENYILVARAKGLSEKAMLYKHALLNAINPLITILGYEFANLFAGSALIEMVLAYPGLGSLTLEAARKLDVNLVLANLLIASFMLVLGNLLADLLLRKLEPRSQA